MSLEDQYEEHLEEKKRTPIARGIDGRYSVVNGKDGRSRAFNMVVKNESRFEAGVGCLGCDRHPNGVCLHTLPGIRLILAYGLLHEGTQPIDGMPGLFKGNQLFPCDRHENGIVGTLNTKIPIYAARDQLTELEELNKTTLYVQQGDEVPVSA
jgi:hypothetical protein